MSKLTQIDGLPVIDAKRPIKLHVTKADIVKAAGSIKEPDKCAVARACYRDLHVLEARVHRSRVYLRTNKDNWVRYATPDAMTFEIFAFDRGGAFEPQEFLLKPPYKNEQLGTKRRGGKKTGTGKQHAFPHRMTNVRSSPL